MDNYISNDNNNPINWNGKESELCERCHNILTPEENQEEQKKCFECIEEEEERKELEKQFLKFPELEEDENLKINLKAQRDTLNKIFDSFSIATIGSFDKDGNLI
tara:strand:+ start:104 stop:418 length:315 start_codon:yes stop_codon:yes gene_type:complete